MTEYVAETYEEVRELLQTASWEIMDEEQRDDVMKKVVVPRWGKVTADGVVLKGTAWAKLLGTTYDTIASRYKRLEQAKRADDSGSRTGPTESQKSHLRGAKAALRQHPELAKQLLGDPDTAKAVTDAIDQQRVSSLPDPNYRRPREPAASGGMAGMDTELSIATHVRKARREIGDAIELARDATFDDDFKSLMADDCQRLRAGIDHLESAITSAEVDIDQALADLLEGGEQ
jgi:hypothetical protein